MGADPASMAMAAKAQALTLGFDVAGVAAADAPPERGSRLAAFLEAGRHGDMGWMEARAGERAAPRALWPEAKSVVMLGLNYGPDEDPLEALRRRTAGTISVYA